ncbi:MAG: DUF1611 domain-containing protein [Blastochloris sp.]|nr:DUF1611 domain-containing protein [Blastochloris sp.]
MQRIDQAELKLGFTTHVVPVSAMVGYVPIEQTPQIGDLVVARVLSLGKHSTIEMRNGAALNIFPGDLIVGAFGNRYATDQYEGYVPSEPTEYCDMLSVGGVIGKVASSHQTMGSPTKLQILGQVCDASGMPLNTQSFGLKPRFTSHRAEVILVVGATMNAGKTTTVGTIVRSLSKAGHRVAAVKVTGTAAGKDGRYFLGCGAKTVFDFTDVGYPSTYMLSLNELLSAHQTLLANLQASKPDYIVVEVADGIFQRETRMLLESDAFRTTIDHVFFAAGDSLAMEAGVRYLTENGWPLRGTAGVITQSPLLMREAEAATGMRCMNIEQMVSGGVVEALKGAPVLEPSLVGALQYAA